MEAATIIKNKYELKELELKALLEITQAINNNLSEEALYKIYNFTLRANLRLQKLALFVKEEEGWYCPVHYGTDKKIQQVHIPDDMQKQKEIFWLEETPWLDFREFEAAIPILHKDNLLAFAFVGGVQIENGQSELKEHLNFIQALSNIIIVAIENKRMARERLRQEAYRKELEIAKGVQQLLFPKKLLNTDAIKQAAHYLPHHSVGGDYYDFIEISETQHLLCIADVSGKGVPAAILMSNFQASLRTLIRKTNDLEEITRELNYQVFQSANGENFITACIVLVDRKANTLDYVNAGHNPPCLYQQDKSIALEEGTTVLGAFEQLPFLETGHQKLHYPATIFLYTDGLTEAINEQEEEFGSERMQKVLATHCQENPEQLIEKMLEAIYQFKGRKNFKDDITLLACQLLAPHADS